MTRLPRLTGREVIDTLAKGGFKVVRVRGSHHLLRHGDGRATTVPVHAREIVVLSREEFISLNEA